MDLLIAFSIATLGANARYFYNSEHFPTLYIYMKNVITGVFMGACTFLYFKASLDVEILYLAVGISAFLAKELSGMLLKINLKTFIKKDDPND